MGQCIGVFGMGVMGRSLALNLARNQYPVAVYDIDDNYTKQIYEFAGEEIKRVTICTELTRFIEALESPKRILVMVTAGEAVDHVMDLLAPYLGRGDMIVDSGNSYYGDTRRRSAMWEEKGIHFCGMGVSGGERGAREGGALMPGGSREAYERMRPIYESMSARNADGVPCCSYVGPDGAGHFVKMVHNGIEYTDMELIAECWQFMDKYLGLSIDEIREAFVQWNKGPLSCYLLDITIKILERRDEITGLPMVEIIKDEAKEKGTGCWTSKEAFDLKTAAPAVADAVFARYISSDEAARKAAVKRFGQRYVLNGDDKPEKKEFLEALREAFYAAKICSYSQGFGVMDTASKKYDWKLKLNEVAANWQTGCIIQSNFLHRVAAAYKEGLTEPLFLAEEFSEMIEKAEDGWRMVCSTALGSGIPVPILCGTLTYLDSYRVEHGTASLIQAQRDFFGAHTYCRIDREGSFHTKWES